MIEALHDAWATTQFHADCDRAVFLEYLYFRPKGTGFEGRVAIPPPPFLLSCLALHLCHPNFMAFRFCLRALTFIIAAKQVRKFSIAFPVPEPLLPVGLVAHRRVVRPKDHPWGWF